MHVDGFDGSEHNVVEPCRGLRARIIGVDDERERC